MKLSHSGFHAMGHQAAPSPVMLLQTCSRRDFRSSKGVSGQDRTLTP